MASAVARVLSSFHLYRPPLSSPLLRYYPRNTPDITTLTWGIESLRDTFENSWGWSLHGCISRFFNQVDDSPRIIIREQHPCHFTDYHWGPLLSSISSTIQNSYSAVHTPCRPGALRRWQKKNVEPSVRALALNSILASTGHTDEGSPIRNCSFTPGGTSCGVIFRDHVLREETRRRTELDAHETRDDSAALR